MRKQVFAKREPVIIACDQTDEHYRFSTVLKQTMQSLQRLFSIACEQVIA
jgi:hypothetical protein